MDNKSTTRIGVTRGLYGEIDEEPDYEMIDHTRGFGSHVNMIPMTGTVHAPRHFYGARFYNQALPVDDPEEPLVQNLDPESGRSFDAIAGDFAGASRASLNGVIKSADDDGIDIDYEDGTTERKQLYRNFPFNRKTHRNDTALVKPGDKVTAGQVIAHSNFTTPTGVLALGRNARVGVAPMKGWSMDDALAISEDFAARTRVNRTLKIEHEHDDATKTGLNHFRAMFPAKFTKDQLANMDEDGVIKVGSIINPGDPLILATTPRTATSSEAKIGKLSRAMQQLRKDSSQTWAYDDPAKVLDVVKSRGGFKVITNFSSPMRVGDKGAFRTGAKFIVSKLIPTEQMPQTKDGKPLDVLLNQLSIYSRVNSALIYEMMLGKLAKKTGKPIVVNGFSSPGVSQQKEVQRQLDEAGISSEEQVYDPQEDRDLENPIMVGNAFVMRLHHTADDKQSSRGIASYDQNLQPSKGSSEGAQAKRQSSLENLALLSSGGYATMREMSTLRGHKCFDDVTEVLTKRGWVLWPDVVAADELFTKNKHDDLNGWFERAQSLTVCDYSGEMFGYEGKHLDWCVTPNHNFWGIPYTVSRAKSYRNKRLFSAEHAFGRAGSVDAFGACYAGSLPLSHQMIFDKDSFCPQTKRKVKEVKMSITDYARFIGWWLSEGSACVDKEGRGAIRISQSAEVNPVNFNEIRELLIRVGLGRGVECKVSSSVMNQGKSVVTPKLSSVGAVTGLRVRSRPLTEHLLTLGNRSWKHRLPVIMFEAPLEARLELLRCYAEGDGCVRTNDGSTHVMITSASRGMMEDLQRLAISCGFAAFIGDINLSEKNKELGRRPQYRLIYSSNLTELSFVKKPAPQYKGHYTRPYSGKVYCATMSTGLLYVRRNEKSMWSGNSDQFWRDYRSGYKTANPGKPFVWNKFTALLQGAGLKARDHGNGQLRLGPLTDESVDALDPVELRNGEMVHNETLEPVKGGLFDPVSVATNRWGKITLHQPIPNPALEEQIRTLIGLSRKDFAAVMAGKMELPPMKQ